MSAQLVAQTIFWCVVFEEGEIVGLQPAGRRGSEAGADSKRSVCKAYFQVRGGGGEAEVKFYDARF